MIDTANVPASQFKGTHTLGIELRYNGEKDVTHVVYW